MHVDGALASLFLSTVDSASRHKYSVRYVGGDLEQ